MRVVAAEDGLDEAVRLLNAGRLVAIPTETVYGLGADATSEAAVARVYAAKGRPGHNPLIAHVADRAMAERYGVFSADAARLADAFWPGGLTLVVPSRERLADAVHAGLATVALRMAPGTMGTLAARLGQPIAAPSANPSGRLSPTRAADVAPLGDVVDLVLDGGPCAVGLESTIVAMPEGQLLRPGAVARERIEDVLGRPLLAPGEAIAAPGMLASHYAPRATLRLEAQRPHEGEVMLGFGTVDGMLNLSPAGDLAEAAANLFAMLRALDALAPRIAVAPVPQHGLGLAINDRLRRAAAPRP